MNEKQHVESAAERDSRLDAGGHGVPGSLRPEEDRVGLREYLLSVIRPGRFYGWLSEASPEARKRLYRIGLLIVLASTLFGILEILLATETHRALFDLGYLTPRENYWWQMLGEIPTVFITALLVRVVGLILRLRIPFGTAFLAVSFPEMTHVWGVVPLTLSLSLPESSVPAYIVSSVLALWTLYLVCFALSSFIRISIRRSVLVVLLAVFGFYFLMGAVVVAVHGLVFSQPA